MTVREHVSNMRGGFGDTYDTCFTEQFFLVPPNLVFFSVRLFPIRHPYPCNYLYLRGIKMRILCISRENKLVPVSVRGLGTSRGKKYM